MARNEEDQAMRAQLALMELEQPEVDERGEILDKQYEAHRLKMSGMTWKQIAKRVGYSTESAAYRAATMYRQKQAVSLSQQQREEALDMQLSRLEALMHPYWNPALAGDIDSANFVLKVNQDISKLLMLYDGQKSEVTNKYVVIQASRAEYVDQLRQIALEGQEPLAISGTETKNTGVKSKER